MRARVQNTNAFHTVLFAFGLEDTRLRVGTQRVSVEDKSPVSRALVLCAAPPKQTY